MADLKEVLIKGNWADEINRYQNELINMRNRVSAIRAGLASLQTTINGSQLATAADNALINGANTFINTASITAFEAAIDANLPILE